MNKNTKITIIGTGAMGTALGKVLSDGGHTNLIMYGIDKNELNDLSMGINTKYFPNSIKLPKFVTTSDLSKALEKTSYVILAVPSFVVDSVFAKILNSLNSSVLVINASKGFYANTNMSLHEGLKKAADKNKKVKGVVSLLGPSHAEEIAKELLTIVATISKNKVLAMEVQQLFNNKYFKTYIQTDVRGAEAGASYKNILAIASGLANGLGCGVNATAALITRGMSEMSRYNKAMKGKHKTIVGLTGLGDLIVTATSDLSRNYNFGKEIATVGVDKALTTNKTVEGLTALKHVYKIMIDKKLDLPIVDTLYQILYKKMELSTATSVLWNRELKPE